jgi:hypothetical protein
LCFIFGLHKAEASCSFPETFGYETMVAAQRETRLSRMPPQTGYERSTHLQGYVTHLLLSEPTLTLEPGLGRPTNGTYDAAQAIILPIGLMLR